MSSEVDKIKLLSMYYKFKDVYSLIKDLSWQISNFQKRFPLPEAMTDEEIKANIDAFIAMYKKLEEAYNKWNTAYNEYKKEF